MICHSFRHDDPDLDALVNLCKAIGAGYMIDYSERKIQMPNTMNAEETQAKLNMIGYGQEFNIIFLKNDETQKQIKRAVMDKPTGPAKNPNVVPVRDLENAKWCSFYLDRVLFLQVN